MCSILHAMSPLIRIKMSKTNRQCERNHPNKDRWKVSMNQLDDSCRNMSWVDKKAGTKYDIIDKEMKMETGSMGGRHMSSWSCDEENCNTWCTIIRLVMCDQQIVQQSVEVERQVVGGICVIILNSWFKFSLCVFCCLSIYALNLSYMKLWTA